MTAPPQGRFLQLIHDSGDDVMAERLPVGVRRVPAGGRDGDGLADVPVDPSWLADLVAARRAGMRPPSSGILMTAMSLVRSRLIPPLVRTPRTPAAGSTPSISTSTRSRSRPAPRSRSHAAPRPSAPPPAPRACAAAPQPAARGGEAGGEHAVPHSPGRRRAQRAGRPRQRRRQLPRSNYKLPSDLEVGSWQLVVVSTAATAKATTHCPRFDFTVVLGSVIMKKRKISTSGDVTTTRQKSRASPGRRSTGWRRRAPPSRARR